MIYTRYIFAFYLLVFSFATTFSQKYFEGKYTQEVTYSTDGMDNTTMISYYKGNKNRTDYDKLTGANPFTSISIVDFDKRERLMLMDMPKLNNKSATLSDLSIVERPIEKLEKFEEYKTILDHKCQKAILTSVANGKETRVVGYADFNYSLKTLLDATGKSIDYPMFFESEIIMPSMTMTIKIVSISEQTLFENVFDANIPSNYKLIDIRKNKTQTTTSSNTSTSSKQVEDFNRYSDSELETKLQTALKTEDFDLAAQLKEAIEKRGGSIFKYRSKTTAELQEMLKKAIGEEDFDSATKLQEEIKKRSK